MTVKDMTVKPKPIKQIAHLKSSKYFYGLGHWNFYFLLKLALFWQGMINFHVFENLLFIAFLVFPLPFKRLHQLRTFIAIFAGIALFYHDSWLPSYATVLYNSHVLRSFKVTYILELLNRFINWSLVGAGFIGFTIYLYVNQWVRISTITILSIAWLALQPVLMPFLENLSKEIQYLRQPNAVGQVVAEGANQNSSVMQNNLTQNNSSPKTNVNPAGNNQPINGLDTSAAPTNENLNAYLSNFYDQQAKQLTQFPTQLTADAQPFDLLVINICSLSVDDLSQVGLLDHPLWQKMDIRFSQFNSATSYSGPAAIRLSRASCGQSPHTALYKEADKSCYLFENLNRLGFETRLALDHSGEFENYLKNLHELANLRIEPQSTQGLANDLIGFDGAPIYRDDLVLNRWLNMRQNESNIKRTATFMNIIPLHDGNKYALSNSSSYETRAQKLFDDLDLFLTNLETSGRKVVVAIVPEHGAALAGDRMQISGLRDIPNLKITRVPAGIKLIGIKAAHANTPLVLDKTMSYLAVSEIVSRLVDGKIFAQSAIDWQALVQNLPETAVVSENENAIVLQYQDKPYVKLKGGDWIPYPQ